MKKLVLYYSFILTAIMVFSGFAGASTFPELISAILFYPVGIYFLLHIIPHRKKALSLPSPASNPKPNLKTNPNINLSLLSISKNIYVQPQDQPSKPLPTNEPNAGESPIEIINDSPQDPEPISSFTDAIDQDRRQFIKLIGSAGISVFMLSLFTKKAQAAFFGSIPGPGTIALKDPTTGQQISPAQEHPTDGYRISQLDDSVPAFYGFVNQTGAWFIMREDSSGNYRYTSGATDFSTNWTNRSTLTYDYYDAIF